MSKDPRLANDSSPEKHRKKRKRTDQEEEKKKKKKHRLDDVPVAGDVTSTKKSKSSQTISHRTQGSDTEDINRSPFYIQRASMYLPIPPIALHYASRGICSEVLSSLLLKYYPPLQGVVAAYANVQISERPDGSSEGGPPVAKSINEYAVSFIWTIADFLIFRPRKGDRVSGWISLQNEGHIGLICYNLFNARIARSHLSSTWTWIDPTSRQSKSKARLKGSEVRDVSNQTGTNSTLVNGDSSEYQGHYEGEDGAAISGTICFTVDDIEASLSADREKSYLMIEGTTIDTAEEGLGDGQANGSPSTRNSKKRRKAKSTGS